MTIGALVVLFLAFAAVPFAANTDQSGAPAILAVTRGLAVLAFALAAAGAASPRGSG